MNLRFLPFIITSACVLHNFILELEGPDRDDFEDLSDSSSDEEYDEPENGLNAEARVIRDRIAASL